MVRTLIEQHRLFAFICFSVILGSSSQAQIPWSHDYNVAKQASENSGAMMLLHFYSDNCVPCKMLDARAFQDPALVSAVKQNAIPVKINADHNPELAKQYSVSRWPTDVYIAADGTELARTVSPQKSSDYIAVVERVAVRHRDHSIVTQAANTPRKELAVHRDPPNKFAASSRDGLPAMGSLSDRTPRPQWTPTSQTVGSAMSAALGKSAIAQSPSQAFATNEIQLASSPAMVPNSNAQLTEQSEGHEAVVENIYCVAPPTHPAVSSGPVPNNPVGPVAAAQTNSTQANPFLLPSATNEHRAAITTVANKNPPPPQPEHQIENEVRLATQPDSGPAMSGYCPVTLDEQSAWKPGNARFAVRHRGRVFHLASQEYQQKFLQNPDRYAPILSGFDLVHFLHTGELRDGLREYGCWYKGRVYLFATAENRAYFDEHVIEFAATAGVLQNGAAPKTDPPTQTAPPPKFDSSEGLIATEPKLPTLSR